MAAIFEGDQQASAELAFAQGSGVSDQQALTGEATNQPNPLDPSQVAESAQQQQQQSIAEGFATIQTALDTSSASRDTVSVASGNSVTVTSVRIYGAIPRVTTGTAWGASGGPVAVEKTSVPAPPLGRRRVLQGTAHNHTKGIYFS